MAEGEKKISTVMIAVMVVVGLALAGGISYFIATKTVGDQNVKQVIVRGPSTLMKLGDPKEGLIVNIGGVNSGRYLKISVIAEIAQDKNQQESAGKSPSSEEIKMLDTVIHTLRSLKPDEFEPAKQENLKDLLKQEMNKKLGEERVYNVYITNLVVQ
ncbi:MAG: flagellar basal body-associated FliL family protein [Sporomusaceae bacterium]|nr:flagellar basal body-associated FliL family protein [Sporomusaceae bacterium]